MAISAGEKLSLIYVMQRIDLSLFHVDLRGDPDPLYWYHLTNATTLHIPGENTDQYTFG